MLYTPISYDKVLGSEKKTQYKKWVKPGETDARFQRESCNTRAWRQIRSIPVLNGIPSSRTSHASGENPPITLLCSQTRKPTSAHSKGATPLPHHVPPRRTSSAQAPPWALGAVLFTGNLGASLLKICMIFLLPSTPAVGSTCAPRAYA